MLHNTLHSIKESFRPEKDQIIVDPNGNEMVMIRGECYEILRLHKHFKVIQISQNLQMGYLSWQKWKRRLIAYLQMNYLANSKL